MDVTGTQLIFLNDSINVKIVYPLLTLWCGRGGVNLSKASPEVPREK